MSLLRTLRRQRLIAPEARVLAALSGGADSVALLFLLRDLAAAGDLQLAGAAHLNHCLRGEAADADQAFCEQLTSRLGIPLVTESIDVAAEARRSRRSVEDTARKLRYEFLERAADALKADVIAVAHTREDQAETFLLRLLRGSGSRGLAAIHPRVGRVVRPLLEVSRSDLRNDLAARGEAFREDASNADVRIPRNRVRHELIPYLERHFTGRLTDVLAREAELARADEDYLREQAIDLSRRIVLEETRGRGPAGVVIRLDAVALASAHRALSTRVAQMILGTLAPRGIEWQHVQALVALAVDGQEDAAVSLPGQFAVRTGGTITLRPGRTAGKGSAANSFAFSLSIPGEVHSAANGWTISAAHLTPLSSRLEKRWQAKGPEVGIAASAVELPLAVRSRRPGDRFRPLGSPGVRKLQDFFVDRKVAREVRDTTPLVVDANDRIVWVVGHTVAEDFRVIDPSAGVLLLKVRRVGGAG